MTHEASRMHLAWSSTRGIITKITIEMHFRQLSNSAHRLREMRGYRHVYLGLQHARICECKSPLGVHVEETEQGRHKHKKLYHGLNTASYCGENRGAPLTTPGHLRTSDLLHLYSFSGVDVVTLSICG